MNFICEECEKFIKIGLDSNEFNDFRISNRHDELKEVVNAYAKRRKAE